MSLVRSDHYFAAVICVAATAGLAVAPAAAQLPTNQSQGVQTRNPPVPKSLINAPLPTTLTCAQLQDIKKSRNKVLLGTAIVWLDGYQSGRSGLTELSAGWMRTLVQGIAGTCGMTANAHRTVLDVIGRLHRDYGGQTNPRFPTGGQESAK